MLFSNKGCHFGAMKNACQWLAEHQLADGGWGENFESCECKEYVASDESQVINTSWALLALMAVGLVYYSICLG